MAIFIILLIFICLSVGLALFFIHNDKGEKEPIGALWLAVGLGFLGAVAALFLELFLLPKRDLMPGASLSSLFLGSMGVGIIEEACKFWPLAAFLYKKDYFNEHTDGVLYFALAGIGFGLPENIIYTITLGSKAGLDRVILTPFFHAATTGMVGYFLAKHKFAKKPLSTFILPVVVAMALHGLYDFGLLSTVNIYAVMSLFITFGMSAALFVFFLRAVESDQKLGLSAVGHNNFCRTCGWPNPQHNLYCTHCGKNA